MKKSRTEFGIEPVSVNWQLPYMLKCHEFKNKRILVVHSYECAFMASINNSVVYVTDDKEKYKKFADKVVNSIHFGNDDSVVLIKSNQWLDLIEILKGEGLMTKFDVAIMNPPYDGDLHLKILNNVKKFVDNVYNISPINKMQHALIFNTELPVKDMAIDRIPMDKANEIFQIVKIRTDLGIWYNGKCSTNIIPHYNLVHKLITKLKTYKTGLLSSKFEKTIGKFPVKFVYGATLAGHGGHGRACYRIVSENESTAFSLKPTGCVRYINVSNYQEQKELQKIYNLIFLRFCYYIIERGNNPYKWLPVFDNTYTNKKFCLEFDITGYIDDEHAEPNSEWEIILNSMKEYV